MQTHFHCSIELTSAAVVQEVAARNLQLLQAIESTVARLSSDAKVLSGICGTFDEVLKALRAAQPAEAIDPQDVICNILRRASDAVLNMHARGTARRKSAVQDKRLREDDGVVDAFTEYLAVLDQLHEVIEEMAEWIDTHDAALEPPTGNVYSNVDDLFAAINKG